MVLYPNTHCGSRRPPNQTLRRRIASTSSRVFSVSVCLATSEFPSGPTNASGTVSLEVTTKAARLSRLPVDPTRGVECQVWRSSRHGRQARSCRDRGSFRPVATNSFDFPINFGCAHRPGRETVEKRQKLLGSPLPGVRAKAPLTSGERTDLLAGALLAVPDRRSARAGMRRVPFAADPTLGIDSQERHGSF